MSAHRQREIENKTDRLISLSSIKTFTYSPTSENQTKDSLSHAEVIRIGTSFLNHKPLMRKLVVSGSPFILIDESQDTNRDLLDALLSLQEEQSERFGLGLFGDMMQRIFGDGKSDLSQTIPLNWSKPQKTVNFRCPKRVIRLINQIRQATDGWKQIPREDASEGHLRLFVIPARLNDKTSIEQEVRERMAEVTKDAAWKNLQNNKTLILEHHMAARRMGFLGMYEPLSRVDSLATGLREGTIGFLRFFSEQVLPVIEAHWKNDAFAVAAILRKYSPLLSAEAFQKAVRQNDQLAAAKAAVLEISNVCTPNKEPTFQQVLDSIAKSNLFEIPDTLQPYVDRATTAQIGTEEDDASDRTHAIREFLQTPFDQIGLYAHYVTDTAPFGTHQGVKGLEFPRVMVIMDDEEARGFSFSYDKLFRVKEPAKNDVDNQSVGKETSIDRTRRLLYVTCSRSEQSLALVAYASDAAALKEMAIKLKWFDECEVEQLHGDAKIR